MQPSAVRHPVAVSVGAAFIFAFAVAAEAQITFDWATVGNAGNAADTRVMTKCPSTSCSGDGTSGYGAVGYTYQIAKQHVTVSQYALFLNTVDPAGTNQLSLYNSRMETFFHPVSFLPTPAYSGGITFNSAAPSGTKYAAKGGEGNFPATHISWVSAARFVNWLSNGQGTSGTESGVYNELPVNSNSPIPARVAGASIFLPTEDEFYKAAYYNPTLNGGVGGYTEFGVGNSAPIVSGPSGGATSANTAVTDGVKGPNGDTYWQTGGLAFDDSLNYRTGVGAYSAATSYYGLHDVDGNAYQWLETSRPNRFNTAQSLPLFRGGSWFHDVEGSGASYRNTQFFAAGSSSVSSNYHGFRIARLAPVTALPGDFNGDGQVNAADYTVWRDGLGSTYAAADYVVWRDNYGATSPAVALAQSVPEPASVLLALLAATAIGRRRGD